MKDEEKLYRELTGKDPKSRYPDDPDWKYKGSKREREELAERMGIGDDDGPVVIEGQEELPI